MHIDIDFMIYPVLKDDIIMFMAKEIMFYNKCYKSNKYHFTVFWKIACVWGGFVFLFVVFPCLEMWL